MKNLLPLYLNTNNFRQSAVARTGVLHSDNGNQKTVLADESGIYFTSAGFSRSADKDGWSVYSVKMLLYYGITPNNLVSVPHKNEDEVPDPNNRIFVIGLNNIDELSKRFKISIKYSDVSHNDNYMPKRGKSHFILTSDPHPPKGESMFADNAFITKRQYVKLLAESFEVNHLHSLDNRFNKLVGSPASQITH